MKLLDRLGLHGMGAIEPMILAALITEEPLLLIGPRGVAKSLLLDRLARALGLEFRHYNASMINFDDVAGFPLPKDGAVEYVRTPASIWGAEAVLFDEISRCRPDIQNRMFSIVHECLLLGMPVAGLRYRWGAMNPPAGEEEENGYFGSEPLDAALADRFTFIVNMPGWDDYSERDQIAIIRNDAGAPVNRRAAADLGRHIDDGRNCLEQVRAAHENRVADYLHMLIHLLRRADIEISPRRAGMLLRAVLSAQAAARVLDAHRRPASAALIEERRALCGRRARKELAEGPVLLALRNALPEPAQGLSVPEGKLLAAHREAWAIAETPLSSVAREMLAAETPLQRIALAMSTPDMKRDHFSSVIGDAYADLDMGAQEAVATRLFETDNAGRLNAALAEQVAETYAITVVPRHLGNNAPTHGSADLHGALRRIKDKMERLLAGTPHDQMLANVLVNRYEQNRIRNAAQVQAICGNWSRALRHLQEHLPDERHCAAVPSAAASAHADAVRAGGQA